MSQIDNMKVFNFKESFRVDLNKREQKQFLLQALNLQKWVSDRTLKAIIQDSK